MVMSLVKDIIEEQQTFKKNQQFGALVTKRKLSEFVELHSNAKQLSEKSLIQEIRLSDWSLKWSERT